MFSLNTLLVKRFILAMAMASVVGCSTVRAPSPADPYEGFNRSVDAFNQRLDQFLIKPVARSYVSVVPEVARTGVNNFFSNIGDVLTSVNNLLQGKPKAAASDLGRFVINSTVGVLGFFDVASDVGLNKHSEDFGQTLGRWGINSGPYLVLPLFGPSSTRDAVGFVLTTQTDPVSLVDNVATRNALTGTRLVDRRAELLELTDSIEGVSLDAYAFVRDAYLARRRNQVYDGDPPPEKFVDEVEDVPQP
ncbi:MAG: VacJ family lipoprotein [Burkholderiales bacterium]|jgi:phospholipid-binding lipoprotein MlaA|nr:VacJ family lipoprotein [Burkholderiales bacterium]